MKRWILGILVVAGWLSQAAFTQDDGKGQESARLKTLKMALSGADRLEVERLTYSNEKPKAFGISGKEKIFGLLQLLDFDDEESGFHCMCDGDHRISLFREGKKIGMLSHHHGRSLRWYDEKWGDNRDSSG